MRLKEEQPHLFQSKLGEGAASKGLPPEARYLVATLRSVRPSWNAWKRRLELKRLEGLSVPIA